MEFCPECKSFMIPKKEGEKTVLVCRSCGHVLKKFKKEKYTIVLDNRKLSDGMVILEETEKKDTMPDKKYLDDLYGSGIDYIPDY